MTTTLRNTLVIAFVVLFGFAIASSIAHAAGSPPTTAPGLNKLLCFDGVRDLGIYSGTCTLNSKGAKGSATLDLSSGDPDGDYAGVYTLESTVYGQLLTNITQMSYHYTGTITPSPGNLSYNIPIDTNGDGSTDFYAFVDAAQDGVHCPGVSGLVDIIHDSACVIYEGGVTPRANWAALVAANPGAKVAIDAYIFVVAERTGAEPPAIWTVNNVIFGKAGK